MGSSTHSERVLYEGIVCSLPDIDRTGDDHDKHKLCAICDKHFGNYDQAITHYMSKSHLKKVGIKKRSLFRTCNVCRLDFDSSEDFRRHISTNDHVARSEKLDRLCQLERKVAPNIHTVQFLFSVLSTKKSPTVKSKHDKPYDKPRHTKAPMGEARNVPESEILLKNHGATCQVCDKWRENFNSHK